MTRANPPATNGRAHGCMVIDLQGPFELKARIIEGGAQPFAVLDFWPDVSVFIPSQDVANDIIAALQLAKRLLRATEKATEKAQHE